MKETLENVSNKKKINKNGKFRKETYRFQFPGILNQISSEPTKKITKR